MNSYGPYSEEMKVALEAVRRAARLSSSIQKSFKREEAVSKLDASPVTVADFGVQALIALYLKRSCPTYGLVAEEDASYLRSEEGAAALQRVTSEVNAADDGSKYSEADILDAIDFGGGSGGSNGRHWVLDPVDGTKGFVRGDQYAICLGLIDQGQVVAGVLGCPNLPQEPGNLDGDTSRSCKRGVIFYAVRGEGAYQQALDSPSVPPQRIHVSEVSDPAWATLLESYESAHSSHEVTEQMSRILGLVQPPLRLDSQCKYGLLARGEGSIYLRFPRKGYVENIWDHCAGSIIIQEAGGSVSDEKGDPLDFGKGRKLQSKGIVASNGRLHPLIIAAVQEVLATQPS